MSTDKAILIDWKSSLILASAILIGLYLFFPKYELYSNGQSNEVWKLNRFNGGAEVCRYDVDIKPGQYPQPNARVVGQPTCYNSPNYSTMSDAELLKLANQQQISNKPIETTPLQELGGRSINDLTDQELDAFINSKGETIHPPNTSNNDEPNFMTDAEMEKHSQQAELEKQMQDARNRAKVIHAFSEEMEKQRKK